MRRRCGVCVLVVLMLLVCAACRSSTVVGVWVSDEPVGYYFELYEDGSCMMFDANDEWVSSGTYTEHEEYMSFDTDTGKFTWVWDEESESMVFEAGKDTIRFRKQEQT